MTEMLTESAAGVRAVNRNRSIHVPMHLHAGISITNVELERWWQTSRVLLLGPAEDIVLYYGVDGANAISPSDLLPFGVSSPVICDSDFEDSTTGSRSEFGSNFGFKSESILFDGDILDDLSSENLVAGFHVGEVDVREHV